MIDATYLKAQRTAIGMAFKQRRGLLNGRTKGGTNPTLDAIRNSQGCSLSLFMIASQVNDYLGTQALLHGLPNVDWFREALRAKSCAPTMMWKHNERSPFKTTNADTNGETGSRSCAIASKTGGGVKPVRHEGQDFTISHRTRRTRNLLALRSDVDSASFLRKALSMQYLFTDDVERTRHLLPPLR